LPLHRLNTLLKTWAMLPVNVTRTALIPSGKLVPTARLSPCFLKHMGATYA